MLVPSWVRNPPICYSLSLSLLPFLIQSSIQASLPDQVPQSCPFYNLIIKTYKANLPRRGLCGVFWPLILSLFLLNKIRIHVVPDEILFWLDSSYFNPRATLHLTKFITWPTGNIISSMSYQCHGNTFCIQLAKLSTSTSKQYVHYKDT